MDHRLGARDGGDRDGRRPVRVAAGGRARARGPPAGGVRGGLADRRRAVSHAPARAPRRPRPDGAARLGGGGVRGVLRARPAARVAPLPPRPERPRAPAGSAAAGRGRGAQRPRRPGDRGADEPGPRRRCTSCPRRWATSGRSCTRATRGGRRWRSTPPARACCGPDTSWGSAPESGRNEMGTARATKGPAGVRVPRQKRERLSGWRLQRRPTASHPTVAPHFSRAVAETVRARGLNPDIEPHFCPWTRTPEAASARSLDDERLTSIVQAQG